jgi:hypothetical protein
MRWFKTRLSQVGFRVSGLPASLTHYREPENRSPSNLLRHIYARRYWSIRSPNEALELVAGVLLAPFYVILPAVWHSLTSGRIHKRSSGRGVLRQFADQLRLYAASGIMPGPYYVFALYDEPTAARARSFLKRSETKGSLYEMIRELMPPTTSLGDKGKFEERCRRHGLSVVPTLGIARGGELDGLAELPERDLFIKPLHGKGGRGAERWIWTGERFRFSPNPDLTAAELRAHILRQSRKQPLIIQPRLVNHASLDDLNCGALATARVLTCLDPAGEPHVIGVALRMALRTSSVVDNFHGGGIASTIDVDTGELGPATNLGKSGMGWLDSHPATGARIAGRKLDWWPEMKALALDAHRAFSDRLFIGWDIAMTPDGPVIIEANGSPDLNILQRCGRRGLADSPFAAFLADRLLRKDAGTDVE